MRALELALIGLVVYAVVDLPIIVVASLRGYGTARRVVVWLVAVIAAVVLWLYLQVNPAVTP